MPKNAEPKREVLPIPDVRHVGLTTYDAKDPDTSFPPIEPLRPPAGAPNVLVVLLDDVGFGASSAFGGPSTTPTAERLADGGLKLQPLSHHRALLADARRAADRAQPPLRRHGRHHRARDLGARLQLAPAEHQGAAGRDAAAERLLDRAVRQVPRGAGVGDEPDRPVRPLADRRRRFEYFYGFVGGENNQWYPALYEGTTPVEPPKTPGGGLSPHGGHDRQGDRLGAPAEGAHARQAVLHVLRARRDARAAPRAEGVGRQVQGQVRPGWDTLREETFARQKELGVIPPTPS